MKLVLNKDLPLLGEMRQAMVDAKKMEYEIAYFDLTPDEYAQLRQAIYWPSDMGEVPHFWQTEIRVDGIPTWYIQKQKGTKPESPGGGVTNMFGGMPDPTKH